MKNRRFFVAESLEYGEFFPVPAKAFSSHGSWVRPGLRLRLHGKNRADGQGRTFTLKQAEAFCRDMNKD